MRIPTKPISAVVGKNPLEVAYRRMLISDMQGIIDSAAMATRPVQEVKETIMREVLTSPKVQETVGKIINQVV